MFIIAAILFYLFVGFTLVGYLSANNVYKFHDENKDSPFWIITFVLLWPVTLLGWLAFRWQEYNGYL